MWIQPGSGDGLDVLFPESEVQREIFAQTFQALTGLQSGTGSWESGVPRNPRLTGHRRILGIQQAACDTQASQGSAGSPSVLPSRVGWAQPFPDWESSTLSPGAMRLPSGSLPPLPLEPLTLSTSGTACDPTRAKHSSCSLPALLGCVPRPGRGNRRTPLRRELANEWLSGH